MVKLIEEKVKPKQLPIISPSQINLFSRSPALWVMKQFYGIESQTNIYAVRGTVIEKAINRFINGEDLEKVSQEALEEFQAEAFFVENEEITDHIEVNIKKWILNAKNAIDEYAGVALKLQERVDGVLEGVPVGGLIDYSTMEENIDLKTVNSVPDACSKGARKGFLKADKRDNIRQQTVYYKLTKRPTSLLFVSPEGSYKHRISDAEADEAYESIKEILEEMKYIFSLDIKDILEYTKPNIEKTEYDFYWNNKLRSHAEDIWFDYL